MTQNLQQNWSAFKALNQYRRAIRKFNNTPIVASDILEILEEAMLAPSSGNLQPYKFHWISSAEQKKEIAQACNGQQAATTAQEIIVISAGPSIAKQTSSQQLDYVENSNVLDLKSKAYYRKQLEMFNKILGIGAYAIWTPIIFIATLLRPSLSLLPIGNIGSRNWAARNAAFESPLIY